MGSFKSEAELRVWVGERVAAWVREEGLEGRKWGRRAWRTFVEGREGWPTEWHIKRVGGWSVARDLGRKFLAGQLGDVGTVRAVRKVEAELRAVRERERGLLVALEEAERRQGIVDALRVASGGWGAKPVKRRTDRKREACAVVLCSDWHVEEVVDPSTVNGMNEYGPDVARRRVQRLCEGIDWLVGLNRSGFAIRDIILWFGGDIITGYIHEELVESNALSPTEAVLLAGELMVDVIESVRAIGGFERIIVPCSYGNHGRTTKKPRVSTGAKNSFEWLAYQTLRQRYADDEAVEVRVAAGEHLYLEVYDQVVRFHHGDAIRYYGGVGGLSIPFRKAVDSWDRFRRADLTCIGHYHTYIPPYDRMTVNGSLIGFNAYALRIKARYEHPTQSFFLIDSHHGVCQATPIWLVTSEEIRRLG